MVVVHAIVPERQPDHGGSDALESQSARRSDRSAIETGSGTAADQPLAGKSVRTRARRGEVRRALVPELPIVGRTIGGFAGSSGYRIVSAVSITAAWAACEISSATVADWET